MCFDYFFSHLQTNCWEACLLGFRLFHYQLFIFCSHKLRYCYLQVYLHLYNTLFPFLYKRLGLKIEIYTHLHTHPKQKRAWLTPPRKDSKTLKSIDPAPLCPCFDIVINWSCTSLPLLFSLPFVSCLCFHHCACKAFIPENSWHSSLVSGRKNYSSA